ncbi:META domain-containing protein [Marinobacter daepoensis]|uniref:META domain-containing protein n=1 Tax=Marinobacter daepoensis TaxID=262077 RepID=A0ABS3BEN8_9GAMM|nr:META domain-containing protein [Marinobacter daepoensis]MBN7770296.1 META domain-containing protein [Marinobacter daepoensis]MBY6033826.1 META domain-containing protein [Marinobacter daepoensis]MBY6079742.1 META domain-containing protein [Marinobacter daepoensis]
MSLAKNIIAMLLVTGSLWGCSISQEQGGDGQMSLAGSQWLVEEIAGEPLVAESQVTIGFTDEGRVFGSSSCNRYNGGWHVQGEELTFSQMATTRMACPGTLMQQEDRFLKLLGDVHRYQVTSDGQLVLETDDGITILATPSSDPAQ